MQPVLQVSNLSVSFDTPRGEVEAVRDVSWQLDAGEVLAVVGESGCGKTVMVQSIMKLLPENSKIRQGRFWYPVRISPDTGKSRCKDCVPANFPWSFRIL